jgi:hypothetical protein
MLLFKVQNCVLLNFQNKEIHSGVITGRAIKIVNNSSNDNHKAFSLQIEITEVETDWIRSAILLAFVSSRQCIYRAFLYQLDQ